MKRYSVVEISLDEVKQAVLDWYTDVLMGNKENTSDMILSGLPSEIVNFKSLTHSRLIELYQEFDLGRNLANKHYATKVIVEDEDEVAHVLFDLINVPENIRWTDCLI